MPFNGSGSFSLAEPAFVPLTTISSAAMNSDLLDIADGLSTCMTTDGQSVMSAQFKGFSGSVTVPGYSFNVDPNTGIYRIAADNLGVVVGGTKILDVSSTGLDVSGTIKQNGITLLPPGLGPLPWAGTTAPSGWLLCYGQSLLRASYADLFAAIGTTYGAVDGTHFSLPDMRGRLPAGKDNMGGSAAGRLTTAGSGVDGATLGAVGGAQDITLDLTMIPPHDHDGETGSTDSQLQISGGGSLPTTGIPTTSNTTLDGGITHLVTSNQAGGVFLNSLTHTHTIPAEGGGLAHPNVQPSMVHNYIIYAGV